MVRLRKRPELLTLVILYISPHSLIYDLDMQWGLNLPIRNASDYRSLILYHRSHSWRSFWISRPIELHTHDPLRYVGGGLKSYGQMVGSVRKFGSKDEEEDWICELMDLAVGKLCLPLKVCMYRTSLFFCSFIILDEGTADDTITGE